MSDLEKKIEGLYSLLEEVNEKLDRVISMLEMPEGAEQPKEFKEMKIAIRDHMLDLFEKYRKSQEEKKKTPNNI